MEWVLVGGGVLGGRSLCVFRPMAGAIRDGPPTGLNA